jgi:hypothetical protein
LQSATLRPNLDSMKTATKPHRPADKRPELAPPGTPPSLAVAPGLLDHKHVAIREDDDTDEDFEASKRLLAAVLDYARKG